MDKATDTVWVLDPERGLGFEWNKSLTVNVYDLSPSDFEYLKDGLGNSYMFEDPDGSTVTLERFLESVESYGQPS